LGVQRKLYLQRGTVDFSNAQLTTKEGDKSIVEDGSKRHPPDSGRVCKLKRKPMRMRISQALMLTVLTKTTAISGPLKIQGALAGLNAQGRKDGKYKRMGCLKKFWVMDGFSGLPNIAQEIE
jgi:hypothetical protein